ncbi:MAG: hypothetical protein ACXV7G_11195 [Halobacteriota archaeon]
MNYRLRVLITVIGVLFFLQYWLGMGVNLFATIPKDTPLAFFSYADGGEVLAHIVNGTLILIIALAIVAISITLGNRILPRLSLLALVFVAAAVAAGWQFTVRGQDPISSITMAMSFIAAYTVYFGVYFVSGRPTSERHATASPTQPSP